MHKEYDELYYPFYGMLTDKGKALYREVLPKMRKNTKTIKPTVRINSDEVINVMYAVHRDRPELIAYRGGCALTVVDDIVTQIEPVYNRLAQNYSSCMSELDKAVKAIIREVSGMSTPEQERYVHDRLVKQVSSVDNDIDQTAYGALVKGKAVCAGYTRAFQLIMNQLDIPCYYCFGEASSDGQTDWILHSWNIILLDGDFYNIDVTWDDCYDQILDDRVAYTYYNCTDGFISRDHRRDPACQSLPACKATKCTFENIFGVSATLAIVLQDGVTCQEPIRSKNAFVNMVEKELKASKSKKIEITFPTDASDVKSNAMTWFTDVGNRLFPMTNRHYSVSATDYRNGWQRIELELTLS